ncbi:MAG: hypothetical protein ACM33U_04125 [Solirubrobacterales bacterium]
MSEENVEVVRQLWKHWELGDWRGGRDLTVDGCEFVFSTSWFPDAGVYSAGPEAVDAWIAFTEAFEEFATGVDQIIDGRGGYRRVGLAPGPRPGQWCRVLMRRQGPSSLFGAGRSFAAN